MALASFFFCSNRLAIFNVPVLIPSLTKKIIFLAVVPLFPTIPGRSGPAKAPNGENNEPATNVRDVSLKKSLLFITISDLF